MDVRIQEFTVNTRGGRLFARRWDVAGVPGRAPIVLFHDSLGCVDLWRDFPQQLALAGRRPVLAYDRLGFGRSDPHPGKLQTSFIRDEADSAFRDLREQLGIGRFVAFGHSVGGGMAVVAAGTHGADCAALVTEAAQTFVEARTVEGLRAAQRSFAQPGQVERLGKYHGDKAAWVLDAWIGTWLSPQFADWSLDEDLRRVRCPTLVIHGELDEYGSPVHPRRIAGMVEGPSTLRLLPDCGHVPHREMAQLVLEQVSRWLDPVP
jgi:pimeloyl-ACP methyl ester carboxylesterase